MYAPAQFRASVVNGWRQLLLFSTGSDIFAYSDKSWVSTAILSRFGPHVYEKYRNSQQNRNSQAYPKNPYPYVDEPVKVREWIGPALAPSLDFSLISRLDTVVVAASSLLLIGFLIFAWAKKQPRSFYATIMTTAMVVGNAFTLGALSEPSDRYQARVIWLVPLLAGCFVLNRVIYQSIKNKAGERLKYERLISLTAESTIVPRPLRPS